MRRPVSAAELLSAVVLSGCGNGAKPVADASVRVFHRAVDEFDVDADVRVVRADRDLEFTDEAEARTELRAAAKATVPAGSLLVYIGAQRFVDVRGLATLVDAARYARDAGRRLTVVAPPRSLRRMIEILKLEAALPCADTVRAAVPEPTADRAPGGPR